ncbi:MAG TPA: LysM peptidoglycan-binding domain-containing protein [Acidimicrobiales bacterium]|jgi:hypothetical protein|nr:LysM peptidoglycan-binding domain-containing protein [Acidimicrobiales bacterium]
MAGDKSFLEIEDGKRIECKFNPAELSVTRSNNWYVDPLPGKGVAKARYGGAGSGMFALSLFFDTTDTGQPVTSYTGQILGLLEVNPKLPGSDEASGNVRPPWVRFHWGQLHSFKAVVTSATVNFDYFSSEGTPLRARADLTLLQFEEEMAFGRQNPTSGTPRPHRVHRISPGETLDRIAAAHYGDPTRWRTIAAANGIEDPFALRPGTLLSIPRLEG